MRYICVCMAAMGQFISNLSNLSQGPWFSVYLPWTFLETRSQFKISFLRKIYLKARRIFSAIPKHFLKHFSDVSSLPWVVYLRRPFESLHYHISYIRNIEFQ